MGYIVLLILGVVILTVMIVGFLNGAKRPSDGRLTPDRRRPLGQPSADAPTPAKSVIETPAQVEQARRHTPPA